MKIVLKKLIKSLIPSELIRYKLSASAERSVLLTFDDGPHPDLTPQVLDILESFRARAVFFVVGSSARQFPDLVREIIRRGHAVGNHTFDHPNFNQVARADRHNSIMKCQETLEGLISPAIRLIRPPYGIINLETLFWAWKRGLGTVLWSKSGEEWGQRMEEPAASIAQHLIDDVRARDIVLLHDNNSKVPEILRRILPELQQKGLEFSQGLDTLK